MGRLDVGGVYAEPLVYDATVYVATENDDVYAIGAKSGKVLWHLHVGTSVSRSVVDSAPTLSKGCGDIDPLGITGTPVIDAGGHEIFVAEETELAGRSGWRGIRHWLVAIGLSSHHVLWHRDIDPAHGNNSAYYYIPAEQQRPALTLANGRVYVAFGGLSRRLRPVPRLCGRPGGLGHRAARHLRGPDPARGRRLGDERRRRVARWRPVRRHRQRELEPALALRRGELGDRIVAEPAAASVYWAPSDWVQLNDEDWDLGSAGPIVVPGTSLLFVAGKPSSEGDFGYLMREGHLGGVGHGAYRGKVCPSGGDFGADASDVIGTGKRARIFVYAACGSGTEALQVTTSPMKFHKVWSPGSGTPNGPPIVAGGLVWALDWNAAMLYGMNPLTGHVAFSEPTDPLEHFATPAVGDGMLIVPTADGVEAFRTGR